jgi:hypothetical protein
MALLASALLLLQELIEPCLLFGGKHFAELLLGCLDFLVQEAARAFLALGEDLIDSGLLLGGQTQFTLDATQEIEAHPTRRGGDGR